MSDRVELVTVKATKEDNRVALYEVSTDHPGGEAFVAGDGKSYRVARTPTVEQKIRDGELVEVSTERSIVSAVKEALTGEDSKPEAGTTTSKKAK